MAGVRTGAARRPTAVGQRRLVKPGVLSWPVLADAIAELAEQARDDPLHPWTVRWPSAIEMASQFNTTQGVVLKALNHLAHEGVLVKVWVPRDDGPQELWAPRWRALAGVGWGSRPTQEQIAAEIVRRGVNGEWAVLPPQRELADHFHVSRQAIHQVMLLLVERRQAVKLRTGRLHRWGIIEPHAVRGIDPRLTAPVTRVVVADLIRRIRQGEFRYRLGGIVHDQPFLARDEIAKQYRVSVDTVMTVRSELGRLGWIVPGPQANARYRLAERVPPVDRDTHPAPRKPRNPPSQCKRAREVADDLIIRIQAGEFTGCPFPGQVESMRHYRASRPNVTAAFDTLVREGWVQFRNEHRGRVAVLANPLPEQPAIRLDAPVAFLGLTGRTVNALTGEGIATITDLAGCADQELLGIRNFGVTALRDVKGKLAEHGFEVSASHVAAG